MIRRYLNLTNGIEWLSEFPDSRFVRIPSTCIEKNDWYGLFIELDHDLIFHLALGSVCIIYDCGCRREVSKTITAGVPAIRDCLNAFWYGHVKPVMYGGLFEYMPGCDLGKVRRIKRKFAYYKRFLAGEIDLRGESRATVHDGDRSFYSGLCQRINENEPPSVVTESADHRDSRHLG